MHKTGQVKFLEIVLLVVGLALVVTLQFVTYQAVAFYVSTPAERGQLGDIFGITNSLFSGFAFVGLFFTIYLQQKQIRIQRAELEQSKQSAEVNRKNQEVSNNLNALTKLIEYYDQILEADVSQQNDGPRGAAVATKRQNAEMSRLQLLGLLADMHDEVVDNFRRLRCTATL